MKPDVLHIEIVPTPLPLGYLPDFVPEGWTLYDLRYYTDKGAYITSSKMWLPASANPKYIENWLNHMSEMNVDIMKKSVKGDGK